MTNDRYQKILHELGNFATDFYRGEFLRKLSAEEREEFRIMDGPRQREARYQAGQQSAARMREQDERSYDAYQERRFKEYKDDQ